MPEDPPSERWVGFASAVFAVQKVADSFSSFLVHFAGCPAFVGVRRTFTCFLACFSSGAVRAVVRETGFVRFQFEFLRADGANLDRISHIGWMPGKLPSILTLSAVSAATAWKEIITIMGLRLAS